MGSVGGTGGHTVTVGNMLVASDLMSPLKKEEEENY